MLINNVPIYADLSDILYELRQQLQRYDIDLLHDIKQTPDNIMVTCPYHKGGKERKPSAGIEKSTGVFHCFTCGEVHSLQEVISYCFGREDDLAGAFGWSWILKNFLTVETENRKGVKLDLERGKSKQKDIKYVTEEELDKYRVYHDYMWTRKMTPEVIDLFDIGYDRDTQSITFPVRDINGNCLFIARRSVVSKFFNYPAGVEKPIYGLYEYRLYCEENKLEQKPDVIICESMIDAITCYVYGKPAVALNGLGNDLQFEQLRKMPCRKFILATDNDYAGSRARERLRKKLTSKIITEYVLPVGRKDINEMTQEEFSALKEIF